MYDDVDTFFAVVIFARSCSVDLDDIWITMKKAFIRFGANPHQPIDVKFPKHWKYAHISVESTYHDQVQKSRESTSED